MGLAEAIMAGEVGYGPENKTYEDYKAREQEMLDKVRAKAPKQNAYQAAQAFAGWLRRRFSKELTGDLKVLTAAEADRLGLGKFPHVMWEGGPFEWAIAAGCYAVEAGVNPDRVSAEAYYSFSLGFYPA